MTRDAKLLLAALTLCGLALSCSEEPNRPSSTPADAPETELAPSTEAEPVRALHDVHPGEFAAEIWGHTLPNARGTALLVDDGTRQIISLFQAEPTLSLQFERVSSAEILPGPAAVARLNTHGEWCLRWTGPTFANRPGASDERLVGILDLTKVSEDTVTGRFEVLIHTLGLDGHEAQVGARGYFAATPPGYQGSTGTAPENGSALGTGDPRAQ